MSVLTAAAESKWQLLLHGDRRRGPRGVHGRWSGGGGGHAAATCRRLQVGKVSVRPLYEIVLWQLRGVEVVLQEHLGEVGVHLEALLFAHVVAV